MGRITLCLYIFLLCAYGISSLPPQPKKDKPVENSEVSKEDVKVTEKPIEIDIKGEKTDGHKIDTAKTNIKNTNGEKVDGKSKNVSPSSNATTPKNLANNANIKSGTNTEIESGALMRGIFVFVGITMICIMYIGFKTYFRRGNKKSPLIRKYGVRTRRSDMEMEPLPLEEDEDDETVFDLGNVTNR